MEIRTLLASAAERLAAVAAVQAVAVVGSHASGTAGDESDVDLFIYVDEMNDQLAEARARVTADLAEPSQPFMAGVPGHTNTDAWVVRGTPIWVDAMYWTTSWAEDELDWRLVHCSPKAGYTTAFWRSIRNGLPVFERGDWHRQLQARAAASYPDDLRAAIIRLNRDLLGWQNPFSFRNQAAIASSRGDGVAAHNAVSKWLASYFDMLFAANRVLHPGEKRLSDFAERECEVLPHRCLTDVDDLVRLTATSTSAIGPHMDAMVQRLEPVCR